MILACHDELARSLPICSNCKSALMLKVIDAEGDVLRWQCLRCGAFL